MNLNPSFIQIQSHRAPPCSVNLAHGTPGDVVCQSVKIPALLRTLAVNHVNCNNALSSPRLSAFLLYDELSQLDDISW